MAKDHDFPGFSVPECPGRCGHSLRGPCLCFRSTLRHHTHAPSPLFNSLEDELKGQGNWTRGDPKNRILCDGDTLSHSRWSSVSQHRGREFVQGPKGSFGFQAVQGGSWGCQSWHLSALASPRLHTCTQPVPTSPAEKLLSQH